jgi:hypothetical protein
MINSCSTQKDDVAISNTKNIIKITIKTQPGNDSSLKSTENKSEIIKIVNYINGLDLKKIAKKPDEYTGMSYIITFYFNDKTSKEYVHFGNMFFKESGKGWYEMPYNQAKELEDIYKSLDNK